MPSVVTERSADRPLTLLRRLASDSARLADAEADLARLELRSLLRRCLAAAIFGVVAFAALLTALIILAQTGVAAVAPNLGSDVFAGLAVGAGILLLAVLCVFGLRQMLHWKPESLAFRWINAPDQKQTPKWTH